jgi:hypothetical protein
MGRLQLLPIGAGECIFLRSLRTKLRWSDSNLRGAEAFIRPVRFEFIFLIRENQGRTLGSPNGICEFDTCRPSHAFQPPERLPWRRRIGAEIPAFRAFEFVSGASVCRTQGGNREKSPALFANIPVLQRLIGGDGFDQNCRPMNTVDFRN